MEQSAFEALMIGVYVFIFIIALTAGVLLMSSVINMVDYANDDAIVGMNGTLAETVGIVDERLYTGAQMIRYYMEQKEREDLEQGESNYVFTVRDSEDGTEKTLKNYIESEILTNYLNQNFILTYKGKQQDKDLYVFIKYQNQVEEGQG